MITGLRELLLIGASGLAREAVEVVRATNAVADTWDLLGFLDDDVDKHGSLLGGFPVLGPVEMVDEHPSAAVVLCPGRPDSYAARRDLAERLGLSDERYATLIHPSATVGTTCEIGAGCVLLAHVDLTTDVTVGRHVIVMPQVVLTHDVRVGDFSTIASGVRLGGGCQVGRGAYIGSGACVRERVVIGEWSLIGMGSVVTHDVPAERVCYGVPAREVSRAPVPSGFASR